MKHSELIVKACEKAHNKLMKIHKVDNEQDLMYFDQVEGIMLYRKDIQLEFDALYKTYYEQLKEEVDNE